MIGSEMIVSQLFRLSKNMTVSCVGIWMQNGVEAIYCVSCGVCSNKSNIVEVVRDSCAIIALHLLYEPG